MHCAACANRNERALNNLPGVRQASVNFALRNARAEFDEGAVSERALHDAVTGNGFQVLTNDFAQDNKERAKQELMEGRLRAFAALLLSFPVALLAMLEIELPWMVAERNTSLCVVILGWVGTSIVEWPGWRSVARPTWTR
jgi:cation transport ATPase